MQKEQSVINRYIKIKNQTGASLVELLISVALLGLLSVTLVGAIVYGIQIASNQGNSLRAALLAAEGLEAARNIRDANFTNLVNGTYGLSESGNQFALSGSSDVTGIFTRNIAISTVSASMKQVVSTVNWIQPGGKPESIAVTTYLGNIVFTPPAASSPLVVNTSAASLSGTDLVGITLQNNSASPLVIDKMTVAWTQPSRSLTQIRIGTTNVWNTTSVSGATLDITNVSIAANATVPLSRIRFNGAMSGGSFTITFALTDGTTKTVTYP